MGWLSNKERNEDETISVTTKHLLKSKYHVWHQKSWPSWAKSMTQWCASFRLKNEKRVAPGFLCGWIRSQLVLLSWFCWTASSSSLLSCTRIRDLVQHLHRRTDFDDDIAPVHYLGGGPVLFHNGRVGVVFFLLLFLFLQAMPLDSLFGRVIMQWLLQPYERRCDSSRRSGRLECKRCILTSNAFC